MQPIKVEMSQLFLNAHLQLKQPSGPSFWAGCSPWVAVTTASALPSSGREGSHVFVRIRSGTVYSKMCAACWFVQQSACPWCLVARCEARKTWKSTLRRFSLGRLDNIVYEVSCCRRTVGGALCRLSCSFLLLANLIQGVPLGRFKQGSCERTVERNRPLVRNLPDEKISKRSSFVKGKSSKCSGPEETLLSGSHLVAWKKVPRGLAQSRHGRATILARRT